MLQQKQYLILKKRNYRNNEEKYEQFSGRSKNSDYTTCNLMYYEYFSKHCSLIAIDVNKQIELENLDLKQKINFVGRLEFYH